MNLLEFHHIDGRPVAFERTIVLSIEAHVSGAGTAVMLGPVESPRDLHLQEEYLAVHEMVTMSPMERAMRNFVAEKESGDVPF